jgi:uracil-DNA glycosylase family 4
MTTIRWWQRLGTVCHHHRVTQDPTSAPSRAESSSTLRQLDALVASCRACPRLVGWREEVAAAPRASFAGQTYWGRAVPGFGPVDARFAIVGLAPAAHGANRTGRMFTGDRSGDVLYAALYRAGLASQPESVRADDGMQLFGVRITAPVHCAPPANKPTPQERDTCAPFISRELELLRPEVVMVLGAFGWQALLSSLESTGWTIPRPRPKFGHGAEAVVSRPAPGSAGAARRLTLLGCYHVSQQNTFTGTLTPAMLDAVLHRAKQLVGLP